MKIILLAGGKGKRLRPLTNSIPKPMVQVAGKPLIEYSIEMFKKYGYIDFIITLCYLPEKVKEYFGDGKKFGIKTSYTTENEKNPLGTAGALHDLKGKITQTFIVCAGDILRECNIEDLINFHKKRKAVATIGIYENKKSDPKSIITLDSDGKILEFIERPQVLPGGSIWSNASIYVFEPEVLNYIKENIPTDFGRDIFPKLIEDGKDIYGYIQTGYFLDVGTLEKLNKAETDIKKGAFDDKK